jgi:thiamine pyrophosphokinase
MGMTMTHSTFTILLGGDLRPTERLSALLAGSRVIAADGGMRHAKTLGLVPELWVGDFDSTPDDLLETWSAVERQDYPVAKAQTDGEIAVSEALSRGAQTLILIGALGGERSDHAMMHLLYAVHLAEQGFDVMLTSGDEEAYPLIAGAKNIDLPQGSLFSVLGLSDLKDLTLKDARYPLDGFSLPFGSSRTISNVAEGRVRFSLQSGRAIILARPYDLSGA